jgi:hypothetical protein
MEIGWEARISHPFFSQIKNMNTDTSITGAIIFAICITALTTTSIVWFGINNKWRGILLNKDMQNGFLIQLDDHNFILKI